MDLQFTYAFYLHTWHYEIKLIADRRTESLIFNRGALLYKQGGEALTHTFYYIIILDYLKPFNYN